MEEKAISKAQIIALGERLKKHYGAIAEVSRRVNQTQYWIGKVLKGKAKGKLSVLKVALEVCEEYEEQERKEEQELVAEFSRLKIA